ncbi:uncharacterized protein BDR25DRAFT_221227 [Lindgomyces ingoldianus]|uniref:Uncharacterized protein n=1 Tax=Lindgomyces ingoldianus TaxID=673940 RepID=A0ACB6QYY8_9PLEO|nr:uncharacterized protein BDR25DRAFT_221227 [Lindgomyces ingoldianus]KAF2472065.1 hypothetical protein BDR25DRAFT_221227 [Lindgomyces ingoldianus]
MAQDAHYYREVIDLLSDDEGTSSEALPEDTRPEDLNDLALFNEFLKINGQDEYNPIDLTALEDIPDVDVPPDGAHPRLTVENAEAVSEAVSEAQCLQMVLNVLPDIAIDHVLNLIKERIGDRTRTVAECERLITHILDEGIYPKETDEASKRKRKRGNDDDDDTSEFEKDGQKDQNISYRINALNLLKDEFPHIPARHIDNTFRTHKTLYKTFGTLERQLQNYTRITSGFTKVINPRKRREFESTLSKRTNGEGPEFDAKDLLRELQAARRQPKRRREMEVQQIEEENLFRARQNNEISDCQLCFDEFPINRMFSCDGDQLHLLCKDCARSLVEMQMGNGKCRPKCEAIQDCTGSFTRTQLQEFLGSKSFERLERLQQQEDIIAACIENLGECPFCDFKAECLPVEVDREFRCQNPECGKTSCRLCNAETHVPKSCEEAKKDGKITIRHVVEEAMSEALIRKCNRCKNPFVKSDGCNKMTCTKCGNLQCYVCSKDVKDYNHFSENKANRCPLHDNVETRHEQEVRNAEAEVLARLRTEHPEISEEELKVEVSDAVSREEDLRRQQGQARHQGFGFMMQGNILGARPAGVIPVGAVHVPPQHPPPPPFPFNPEQQANDPQAFNPLNLFANRPHPIHVVLPQAQAQAPPLLVREGNAQPQPFHQVRQEYVLHPFPDAWFGIYRPPNPT